jgi:hypothetical protein
MASVHSGRSTVSPLGSAGATRRPRRSPPPILLHRRESRTSSSARRGRGRRLPRRSIRVVLRRGLRDEGVLFEERLRAIWMLLADGTGPGFLAPEGMRERGVSGPECSMAIPTQLRTRARTRGHRDSLRPSIVVSPVGIATALGNCKHVENPVIPSSTTPESKRTDSEFLVWRPFERFEVVRRLAPLVRDDLVQFGTDSILGVFVEAVELSVGCVGQLLVPLVTHRRCARPARDPPSPRRSLASSPLECRLHSRASPSDQLG